MTLAILVIVSLILAVQIVGIVYGVRLAARSRRDQAEHDRRMKQLGSFPSQGQALRLPDVTRHFRRSGER